MKLTKGYSIGLVSTNQNQFALVMGDCPCTGQFTGLVTETNTIDEAIAIFNKHIPLLDGNVLDQPVLIKQQ